MNPFQDNLKARWILLAISTLLVYCITPVSRETMFDFNHISTWLQAMLILLSFPSGALFVLLAHGLTDGCRECSIIHHFQIWLCALALGYLQWFHLVPALLRRKNPAPVSLNLSTAGGASILGAPTAPYRRPLEDGQTTPTEKSPVPQFDEHGLTPVERILRDGE